MPDSKTVRPLVRTGIAGLDDIVGGGLPRNRMYLLQGDPGAGKTTLALQFLREGVRVGERALYVTLSETPEELEAVARCHGWTLEGIHVHPMGVGDTRSLVDEEDNTLYAPGEVELGERMTALLDVVDAHRPARIVLDSCTELRLLAQSPLRFRRQVLALKEDLVRRDCTIVLIDNPVTTGGDPLLQSLVHGVIVLEQIALTYGAERRRLRVNKLRQTRFRGGYHDMAIRTGGLEVFPRLVASEHHEPFAEELVSSGIAALDALAGGGIERGTATLIVGPAGSAKSALATQYAVAAARRGERVALFAFDEGLGTLMLRARGLGMPLDEHVANGMIEVRQVDPAELSPGELIALVRSAVAERGARLVVIDSLNGYLHSMPEERFLALQLHELLAFLRQRGVIAIMVIAQHGLVGAMATPIDVSYLSDNVVLTRFFEAEGRVRKAISIVKKRAGRHEDTIREMTLGHDGIRLGEPLTELRGVLTGVPSRE
jgi:circadian clock protein KaiC